MQDNFNENKNDSSRQNKKNIFIKTFDWCKRSFLHPTTLVQKIAPYLLLFLGLYILIFKVFNQDFINLHYGRFQHAAVLINNNEFLINGGDQKNNKKTELININTKKSYILSDSLYSHRKHKLFKTNDNQLILFDINAFEQFNIEKNKFFLLQYNPFNIIHSKKIGFPLNIEFEICQINSNLFFIYEFDSFYIYNFKNNQLKKIDNSKFTKNEKLLLLPISNCEIFIINKNNPKYYYIYNINSNSLNKKMINNPNFEAIYNVILKDNIYILLFTDEKIYKLNLLTNNFNELHNLITKRTNYKTIELKNLIFIVGGDKTKERSKMIEIYNESDNTITDSKINKKVDENVVIEAFLDKDIIIFSGEYPCFKFLSSEYQYDNKIYIYKYNMKK